MKRLPLVASFVLFILLCASVAYWALELFKPPLRPVAAPPRVAKAEVRPEAAAGLFGARPNATAVASNFQLVGVIFSGNPRDSVAILSTEGKPPQAVRVDAEVIPGVTVKEVHRNYVLLAEGGTIKRVELPEDTAPRVEMSGGGSALQGRSGTSSPAISQGGLNRAPAPPPGAQIRSRGPAIPPAQSQSGPTAPPVPKSSPPSGAMPQATTPGAPAAPATTAPPTVVVNPPAGGVQPGMPPAPNPQPQVQQQAPAPQQPQLQPQQQFTPGMPPADPTGIPGLPPPGSSPATR